MFENNDQWSDLKIIDFGHSKIIKSYGGFCTGGKDLARMNTRTGTPNYISPEVLAGNYG